MRSSRILALLSECRAHVRAEGEDLRTTARLLADILGVDGVALAVSSSALPVGWCDDPRAPIDRVAAAIALPVRGAPVIIHDTSGIASAPVPSQNASKLSALAISSMLVLSTGESGGWVAAWTLDLHRRWTSEDLLIVDGVATILGVSGIGKSGGARDTSSQPESQRVLENANILVGRFSPSLAPLEIRGPVRKLLGVEPAKLIRQEGAVEALLPRKSRKRLKRTLAESRRNSGDFHEEIQVLHQETGALRWFRLEGRPVSGQNGELEGWEGSGIDITEERAVREQLVQQNRRIEALFTVSRALQERGEPEIVMLKGLRALVRATESDCGLGFSYDPHTGALEITASHGLSYEFVEGFNRELSGPTIVREVIESRRGVIIEDIQNDPRAVTWLARREGVHAALFMPLFTEDGVRGALVLNARTPAKYSEADLDLVSVATGQIALALEQAAREMDERRHAQAVRGLYRLSHEVSKLVSPHEIAERALPIMQSEFGLRRVWFGLMNEQRLRLAGIAGFGPGVDRKLIELQVELDLRHDFLDQAISSQEPVVVSGDQEMECSGLRSIMDTLKPSSLVIVPGVSLGQVVGILIAEPINPLAFIHGTQLPLLRSMVNEIAAVILARRFESRVSEAGKMRMAGLLAAGVAHNFNNLLQAVMGQASLIDIQAKQDPGIRDSARMILDAAARGAKLVSQLRNYTSPARTERHTASIPKLLTDSEDFYHSVLGSRIAFTLEIEGEIPEVKADISQLQQVFANLLMNARDAIGLGKQGSVRVVVRRVRLRSGEIDPELAPGVYLRIDFEDSGAGMDAERMARCFEPFFTTKGGDASPEIGFESTGLGLSFAYSVMKQHDGLITVQSTEGVGSVFSVYLPVLSVRTRSLDDGSGEPVLGIMYGLGAIRGEKLLKRLHSQNTRFVRAHSSEHLLQLLSLHDQTIRMALLDIDQGGSETMQLLRQLRAQNGFVSIVVVTAQPERWRTLVGAIPGTQLVEKRTGALRQVEEIIRGLAAGTARRTGEEPA